MVTALITKLVSLFLIMGAGFVLTRIGILKSSDSMILSKICVYLVTPCSIINAFQVPWTAELGTQLLFSLAAAIVCHLLLLAIAAILRGPLHLKPVDQVSIAYPNALNLPLPIVNAILGSEYVIFLSPYMLVQTILMWSHGRSVLCGENGVNLKKMFLNVQMCSVMVGIVLLLTRTELPGALGDAISSAGSMIGPLSVLITGMVIGGMNFRSVLLSKRVYLVAAIRLLAAPVLIMLIFKLTGAASFVSDGKTILMITLLPVMGPAASTIQQIAQIYGRDVEHAGAVNMVTMLACIVTMPLLLLLW